jgi:hypothetical protein
MGCCRGQVRAELTLFAAWVYAGVVKRSWIWIAVWALVMGITGTTNVTAKPSPAVVVHVQSNLSVLRNVHISFRPTDRLPLGGYYYAVIVLKPYKRYTQSEPPPCTTSSDMERTDYGYSYDHRTVSLTLAPAESSVGHWCRSGTYIGGIYAVPHPPPCNSTYPCRSEPYKTKGPCWDLKSGHRVCGKVAQPYRYSYPEGLPRPIASGTRIIGHFQVAF